MNPLSGCSSVNMCPNYAHSFYTSPKQPLLQEPVYRALTLLDMQGNIVKQWRIGKGQTRISQNISSLASGTYMLKLENKYKAVTYKVIKL